VSGFNKAENKGVHSNEVRNSGSESMSVKMGGSPVAEGIWKNIKNDVKAAGGKYCVNVYAAMKSADKKLEIVLFQFIGAATGAWFEFVKASGGDKVIESSAVQVDGFVEVEGEAFNYNVPTLKLVKVSEASDKAATELDVVLQEFLEGKLKSSRQEESGGSTYNQAEVANQAPEPAFQGQDIMQDMADEEDDLPF